MQDVKNDLLLIWSARNKHFRMFRQSWIMSVLHSQSSQIWSLSLKVRRHMFLFPIGRKQTTSLVILKEIQICSIATQDGSQTSSEDAERHSVLQDWAHGVSETTKQAQIQTCKLAFSSDRTDDNDTWRQNIRKVQFALLKWVAQHALLQPQTLRIGSIEVEILPDVVKRLRCNQILYIEASRWNVFRYYQILSKRYAAACIACIKRRKIFTCHGFGCWKLVFALSS